MKDIECQKLESSGYIFCILFMMSEAFEKLITDN